MGFSLRVPSEERTLKARNNGCKVNDKRHRNSHQLFSLFEILIKIMKTKMLEASRIQGVLSTKKK